mmetsp:Transcript_52896/g.59130  ORF Transcript_52896/g.59130 Transcript_52896/m.59130 type:complete len:84 (+) Transcript_52896:353-604(+)
MQQMIDINLGVISSQEVEAQAAELELDRDRKQAAKVIAIEKFEEMIDERKSNGGTITADYYADIYDFDEEGPYGHSKQRRYME